MRLIGYRRIVSTILVSMIAMVVTGCVMTKTQARLTATFAEATSGVATQNLQILQTYQQLRETRILISEASQPAPAEAFYADLHKYIATMRGEIEKHRAATRVLDEYGTTLRVISSDKHSTDLSTSAKTLGGSLGEAIKQANNAGLQLNDSIALTAAKAVRATGGIFIRRMQYRYLKQFVNEGDQLVEKLSQAIASELSILERHIVTTDNQGNDTAAREFDVLTKAGASGLDVVERFAAFEAERRLFVEKINKLQSALPKLKVAQSKLAASLNDKESLQSLIDSISALVVEVKAAQAVAK
jgi:hypothetical protein